MNWRASESIEPHSGRGGRTPRPTKLNPATFIILRPILMVDCTINGPIEFGRMCTRIILRSLDPYERAASMNSISRMDKMEDRMIRANAGTPEIASAKMMFFITLSKCCHDRQSKHNLRQGLKHINYSH